MAQPKCFGDASEYDEYGGVCKGCSFRLDCANTIQRIQSRIGTMRAPSTQQPYRTVTPYQSPQPTQVSTTQNQTTSSYTFDKQVAPQFGTYVGFSMLEALLVEAQRLVYAARRNYLDTNR